jgi:hypothetical protein
VTGVETMKQQSTCEDSSWVRHLFLSLRSEGYVVARSGTDDIDAVYLPALNQIWIDQTGSLGYAAALRAHEFFHADSSFMQPPMLHPLRNYLLNVKDRPNLRDFEDVVESLVTAVLPVLEGRPPVRKLIAPTDGGYEILAGQYLELARSLARHARKDVARPVIQSLRMINFLLMHVRPFAAGTAGYLVQLLSHRELAQPWANCWELFFVMYGWLADTLQRSPHARSRFLLAPPLDPHRCVGEMLIFLSGALLTGIDRPTRLTPTIPALLGLLSMGGLFVLPVLTVTHGKGRGRVRVSVIHSTRRDVGLVRGAIETQRAMGRLRQAVGVDCPTAPLFSDLLKVVMPFRVSTSSTRVPECICALLRFLSQRIASVIGKRPTCPGCEMALRDPMVAAAAGHVANMPSEQREAFLAAAQEYERWLLTEGVTNQPYATSITVTKSYRYL